jgi:Kef-type K+ transport system membrane component KefB
LFAIVLFSIVYVGVMGFVARPVIAALFARLRRDERAAGDGETILACAILLASAVSTELLGLHYLIGAFAAGIIMPGEVKSRLAARLESVTVVVLLPFYFIVTGLKVTVNLQSADMLLFFVVVTLVASAGKILGTAIPARMCGQAWPEALHLGALMQSKGLMEVLVLTILLDAGVISGAAFSAMILMALVTTALTIPLAKAVGRDGETVPEAIPVTAPAASVDRG